MTLQDMLTYKKQFGFTNTQIAERSGVPLGTVQKVFGGSTRTPRYDTLQALSRFFEGECVGIPGSVSEPIRYNTVRKESSASAVHSFGNGEKTISDYLALPDDVRVELIDGVFYEMAAPTSVHQRIAGMIHTVFDRFVEENEGPCVPLISPVDVQLDCDDRTMVQPDVLVICDQNKLTRARIIGAPDLVNEVLSPSNWYHDMVRKKMKYQLAGVREYWIVVPEEKKVLVFLFTDTERMTEYSFDEKVPVSIWGGKCEVDFSRIYQSMLRTMPFLIEE